MSYRQEAEDAHALALAKCALGHDRAGRAELHKVRELFAKEHGWKEGKWFGGVQLAHKKQVAWRPMFDFNGRDLPNLDHTYYFKQGRIPMAIVTFPYNNSDRAWAEMHAAAEQLGLTVELLDWPNWYSTRGNSTTGIIWRRK